MADEVGLAHGAPDGGGGQLGGTRRGRQWRRRARVRRSCRWVRCDLQRMKAAGRGGGGGAGAVVHVSAEV